MRKNLLILLQLFLSLTMSAQSPVGTTGKTECTIVVEGVEREFIVYYPEGYTSKKLPVVFMFHGTSGNGDKFYNISGWKEKADRTGLIAVFPSAIRYCIEEDGVRKNTTKWNEGKLGAILCEGQTMKDDVLFFREMVNYLEANYPVDNKRIYASGFSNGAGFVSRLTLEASDILAATTMVAGFLNDTGFQKGELISAYLAIGDLNISKNTGILPEWNSSAIEMNGLYGRVISMVDAMELNHEYQFEKTDSMLTYKFDQTLTESNHEFRFSIIKDLPHRYPNGKNHSMIIADLFWDFFSKYSK